MSSTNTNIVTKVVQKPIIQEEKPVIKKAIVIAKKNIKYELVHCPSCGGSYDGVDYFGAGCSRSCAYGDLMDDLMEGF